MARRLRRGPRTRAVAGALLVMAVLAMHGWVIDLLARHLGPIDPRLQGIETLQAVFTRRIELADAAPAPANPAAPPAPGSRAESPSAVTGSTAGPPAQARLAPRTPQPPRVARPKPAPPVEAASTPVEPPLETAPEIAPDAARNLVPAEESATTAPTSASASAPASEPASAPSPDALAATPDAVTPPAASAAPGSPLPGAPRAFDWPVSTRLSYRLTGWYQGPIDGAAEVRWLRDGARYQVHIDTRVGLPFAPLFTRTLASDGLITVDGLVPRRYEQVSRMAFQGPRREAMTFQADQVHLANGRPATLPAGTQDTASQFVQMIYLFRTNPALLAPGRLFTLPLALPHRVGRWTYEVVALETLHFPFGPVEAFHLRPVGVLPSVRELTIEMWFAPRLQYLPVRFLIHQDAETFTDLALEDLPEQAAPELPVPQADHTAPPPPQPTAPPDEPPETSGPAPT